MKKTTLQDIANSLGISRTTVWKVFSGHEGVSNALREKIISRAHEMNYIFPTKSVFDDSLPKAAFALETGSKSGVGSVSGATNIAVAVCRPETSQFWMTIIHQIAKEFSGKNVNLLYTYLPAAGSEEYMLPAALTNGTVNGIIIMNVYDEHLIRLLASLSVPKIFLDIPTNIEAGELNGDLLMMKNAPCTAEITRHLIWQGKTSLGFIGDIHYARSNYERFSGFIDTLKEHGLVFDPHLSLIGSIGADTYKDEIEEFVDRLPSMPEAFVCASDHVAGILMSLLLAKGLRIPQDIMISGFDGNSENPFPVELTTVQVYNYDIGRRLANQILYRIRYPHDQFMESYIASRVLFRRSTEGQPSDRRA